MKDKFKQAEKILTDVMLQRSEKETNQTKNELFKISQQMENRDLVTNLRLSASSKTEDDLLEYFLKDEGCRVQSQKLKSDA